MENNLAQKNVLITGSSKGIGKAIALAFAKQGANVLINFIGDDHEAEEVRAQAEKLGVRAYKYRADVSDSHQVQDMFRYMDSHLGQIDILVNNAGFAQASSVLDLTDEQWDRMIKVHLYGCFYNCREAAKRMKERNKGKIINISSDIGSLGCEEFTHYSAAKGGINAFTKALARELAPNILVNAVAPSGTLTDILQEFGENYIEEESAKYPLKRLAQPEEIAKSVLFLASDNADFYTGQILTPNGGVVMNG
ncbi:3-oxoacyl-ACP reductase FabG [Lysinibacillus sphaericus]|uniref:3-oxoacyl-ACP reductase FabG n=2 Tax=Lysinibacillus TaxID=400634 RepID=A0ABY2T938_9BACI|nr:MULTISPECIES: 3-oxoacyl-ACP reductase family protein [Lysinibacillus]AHN23373.1 3-oxoacyl-ACP reductase [Lysinibacillus varians]TKI45656.1 3-oxoacyl-ACP reductase FabG [Lysinibacillus tabacifolii]TKI61048.1 3-oxoacyl-ACP reductase FabG [Lysinibacillus varians]UDK98467.1 3-oxoacyl-ACP reductase FabG [Lysinibacillus sphaericus]